MIKVKNNSPATGDNIKIIDEIVRRHNIHRGDSHPQEIQTTFGFVPPEAITCISDLLDAESELYSMSYAQFRLEPVGKYYLRLPWYACHHGKKSALWHALVPDGEKSTAVDLAVARFVLQPGTGDDSQRRNGSQGNTRKSKGCR